VSPNAASAPPNSEHADAPRTLPTALDSKQRATHVRFATTADRRCRVSGRRGAVGVVDRIGADHIHGNVHRAVEAQVAEAST
jgi:hypothetical protein